MATTHNAAVIGAGVFGAWTAYHLQRSGMKVVLVDAYGPSNSRASSGGESRIIRMGYGGDEMYTRGAMRAWVLWQDFFHQVGEPLFHRTGVLWMAREGDRYAQETLTTLQKLGVNHQQLGREQLEELYPQISFGQVTWGILEPGSGALMARRAVQAVVRETLRHGASYIQGAVSGPTGKGHLDSLLTTSGESLHAELFVFACGSWLAKVFPELLGERIVPTRQEVFFFGAPAGNSRFRPPCPPGSTSGMKSMACPIWRTVASRSRSIGTALTSIPTQTRDC